MIDIQRLLQNGDTDYHCPECGHTIRMKFRDFRHEGLAVTCEACHQTSAISHDVATQADLAELDALVEKVEGKVNHILDKIPFRKKR